VRAGADTRSADGGLLLIGLEPDDQFLEVLGGDCVLADDQHRVRSEQTDGLQVLDEIVRQRIDRTVDDVRADVAHADGVAVGRRARRAGHADRTRGSRDVLDHDGLAAERLTHALADGSRERVARPARRERHDDGDRLGRKRLRRCGSDAGKQR
jgi:hypothetical protein